MADGTSFLFLSHDNKIGDAIVLTGVFAPIKARWPDARIGVLCGRSNAVIYQAHPLVDAVHTTRSRSLLARMAAALGARMRGYEQLVHFGSDVDSRSLRSLVRLTGIQRCLLFFAPTAALCQTQRVIAGDWEQQHVSQRHSAFLESLGLPVKPYRYDLRLPPQMVREAQEFLTPSSGPQIVIACDASTANRSLSTAWLGHCCAALQQALSGAQITLLCGNHARYNDLQALCSTHPSLRLAPQRSDPALALALVSEADLLVSPDTFAVHAAAAFDRPVLALYPSDAHTLVSWAPRSSHSRQMVAPAGLGLDGLSVADVAAQCAQLLQLSSAV